MSFPKYDRYKDSGVEWLGEVPEHWKMKKLKHVTNICLSNIDKHTVEGQQRVSLCNYLDVYRNERISSSINFMQATASDDQIERLGLIEGDVIITKDSEDPSDIGVPALIVENIPNLVCGYHLALIRSKETNGEFLHYLFCSNFVRSIFETEATGLTRYALGKYSIENLTFAVPPLPEQRSIATFLDRETTKIDELIAEQQQLIDLLKEKRQAVISHAVTKGLNPDAPMKDSAIEWLGEVPEHWEISSVKRLASICYGIGEPPKYQVEGIPLVRATNVNAGKISLDGIAYVNPNDIPENRIVWLKEGDIIVVRSGAYTGDSAIIPEGFGECIAGFDMVLQSRSINPMFMQFTLLSKYLKEGQIDTQKMRSAQPHLNAEELGSCLVALPPLPEQRSIAAFLDRETAKFDELIAEAHHAIALLRERRTALISAAVTGKIDVRSLV